MRDYAKLTSRLYTGTLGQSMKGDFALLALAPYLIGGKPSNMIGLYRLTLGTILDDIGMDARTARRCLRLLEKRGFLRWDHKQDRVWIVEAWRIELCRDDMKAGDLKAKQVAKLLREHLCSPLVEEFYRRYPATREAVATFLGQAADGACHGASDGACRGASNAPPPETGMGHLAHARADLQEQEQEQEQPPIAPRGGASRANGQRRRRPEALGPTWGPHPGDLDPFYDQRRTAELLTRHLVGDELGDDEEILRALLERFGRSWPPAAADLEHFAAILRDAPPRQARAAS